MLPNTLQFTKNLNVLLKFWQRNLFSAKKLWDMYYGTLERKKRVICQTDQIN